MHLTENPYDFGNVLNLPIVVTLGIESRHRRQAYDPDSVDVHIYSYHLSRE